MYLNKVTLIGYLAHDAESRTSRDGRPYVVLAIATKESWKDAKGDWQTHTDSHRCVTWGPKFTAFAAGLKRSAHLQIEGSLRSREFQKDDVSHRVSEVRVSSIIKIERGERSAELIVPDAEFIDSIA